MLLSQLVTAYSPLLSFLVNVYHNVNELHEVDTKAGRDLDHVARLHAEVVHQGGACREGEYGVKGMVRRLDGREVDPTDLPILLPRRFADGEGPRYIVKEQTTALDVLKDLISG